MSLALQDFPSIDDTAPPKPVCRQCTATLDADDNYCRRCGVPTARGVSLGVSAGAGRPAAWESPWVVLPLLFFVLGPLALPLMWRSRRFTLLWKWIFTVIITALTVFFVLTTWITLQRTLAPLQKALDCAGYNLRKPLVASQRTRPPNIWFTCTPRLDRLKTLSAPRGRCGRKFAEILRS